MSYVKDKFFGGAEKKAARTQAAAAEAGIATQERFGSQAAGRLDPFTSAGTSVLNPLLEFVKSGPETELERVEGFTNIQNSAAAGGKLRSGGTLKALTSFNNMLNFRKRGQRFNELYGLATLGQRSAVGQGAFDIRTGENISGLQVGKGDALAAGIIGSANRSRATISDIASFLGTAVGRKKPGGISPEAQAAINAGVS